MNAPRTKRILARRGLLAQVARTSGWDELLEDEAAFAGFWGDVTVSGGTSAWASVTGGVNNGPAAQLAVEDIVVNSVGGWWSGLMWQNQVLPLRPRDEIFLYADIKGLIGTGGKLGKVHVRVEDAEGDYLGFVVTATDEFQAVGGPLSQATEGTFIGDGTFHPDHPPHTVAIAFYEEWDTWGSGGTIIADNVFMTPADFGTGGTDFSAVVAFADEMESWGASGSLTVDNLRFVVVDADVDSDDDTDLLDFAAFQVCYTGGLPSAIPGCAFLDFDDDADIDLAEFADVQAAMEGPR